MVHAPVSTSLPVLDLSRLDGDEASASSFRDDLRAATHDVGFFSLVGHGIPDDVVSRAFATAEAFFALPAADKLGVEMRRGPHFRGYTRTGGELTQGRTDWREQIDIGAELERSTDPARPRTCGWWDRTCGRRPCLRCGACSPTGSGGARTSPAG